MASGQLLHHCFTVRGAAGPYFHARECALAHEIAVKKNVRKILSFPFSTSVSVSLTAIYSSDSDVLIISSGGISFSCGLGFVTLIKGQ